MKVMVSASAYQQIEDALVAAGVKMLGAYRTTILAHLDSFTNETLDKVLQAFAANIQEPGLKGIAAGIIRDALVKSIPALEQLADADEQAAFDALTAYLQHLLQSIQKG